jgi:DNA adenine methylase/adenine-specific DNA-methyltransferase
MAERVRAYPTLRFMGSKHRLLPWLHDALAPLAFETALDAFSGSGAVAYLLKAMGKTVTANDALRFSATIAHATVGTATEQLEPDDLERLLADDPRHPRMIEETFSGVFFTPADLRFLDLTWWNLRFLADPAKRALAIAALCRSCVKRQPRGVFTVAGDPERYKDGRRDLRLSLRDHFIEQVGAYNASVFDTGRTCSAGHGDVFEIDPAPYDLVYLDPPYVPRSDDNCYVKRYHFLEGLSCYWEGLEIMHETRVKKIKKTFTPFSYRRTALLAFDALFRHFRASTLVLSYSSNGYPDLSGLIELLEKYKPKVVVRERAHRYHFGTHSAVRPERSAVTEYLIVGSS